MEKATEIAFEKRLFRKKKKKKSQAVRAEHFTGDVSVQSRSCKNMKSKGVAFVGSLCAAVPAGTKRC